MTKKKKDKPEKIKYSKFIVFLVIILNVWFANKVLNVYAIMGSEPMTLITAFFAFTVGELFLLSGIKKKEIEKEKEAEKKDDEERV